MALAKRNEPATGHQLHTIAVLCQILGILDPIEEARLTMGEAGIIIRRLYGKKRQGTSKKDKGGN